MFSKKKIVIIFVDDQNCIQSYISQFNYKPFVKNYNLQILLHKESGKDIQSDECNAKRKYENFLFILSSIFQI